MEPVTLTLPLLAALAGVATVAGCMDAVAGGGGLLTAPALMMAGLPPHEALGTNKGQAIFGSGMTTATLWKGGRVDKARARWRFPLGVLGGMLGTLVLLQVSNQALKPLCMVLLVGAALLMFVRKRTHRAVSRPDLARVLMALGQLAGGWLGAHLLMRIGPEWVRRAGVAVCVGLVCKLGWDWRGGAAQAQTAPSADNAPAAAGRAPAG